MVEIHIDGKLCKGCYFCIEVCPATVFGKSNEHSPKGYIIAKVERPEDCITCRMCERICPDFAISVHEEDIQKLKA